MLNGMLRNGSARERATHLFCLFIGVQTTSISNTKSCEFSASHNPTKLASCTSETAPGLLISSHSDIKNILHINCYYACKNDTKKSFIHRLLLTLTPLVILMLLSCEDFCPGKCNHWEKQNFHGWDGFNCVHSSKFSRNALKNEQQHKKNHLFMLLFPIISSVELWKAAFEQLLNSRQFAAAFKTDFCSRVSTVTPCFWKT